MKQDLSHLYTVAYSDLEGLLSIGVTEVVIDPQCAEMLTGGVRLSKKKQELQRIATELGLIITIAHPLHGDITIEPKKKEQDA